MITNHSSVRSIACVASVETAFALLSIQAREDLYLGTYKPVSERFQYHLQDASKANKRTEHGIVVTDHRGAQDDHRFRLHHQKLLYSSGKSISSYRNLIEGLFVQPSNMSVGIQLADLVAGPFGGSSSGMTTDGIKWSNHRSEDRLREWWTVTAWCAFPSRVGFKDAG